MFMATNLYHHDPYNSSNSKKIVKHLYRHNPYNTFCSKSVVKASYHSIKRNNVTIISFPPPVNNYGGPPQDRNNTDIIVRHLKLALKKHYSMYSTPSGITTN